ncbi:hypothetical protein Nepgr_004681 [Nepenthes gracilis]|uniref:Uncharacterized protein n=1 Tax=Nepenthes gracilis TaxID=150966 RepID=A0AAD3S1Z6_NEPGR|nr:hypothetical protein Nepgr_004681 [Nepenthes gracilis]
MTLCFLISVMVLSAPPLKAAQPLNGDNKGGSAGGRSGEGGKNFASKFSLEGMKRSVPRLVGKGGDELKNSRVFVIFDTGPSPPAEGHHVPPANGA